MISDAAYSNVQYKLSELEHRYGENIHILSDPFLLSHLALLCREETKQPIINQLVETIYSNLVKVLINAEFPQKTLTVTSRMAKLHAEGVFASSLVDPNQPAVCVNLARAGTFPSHICYNALNYVLNSELVRQDHISINRSTNHNEQVVGTTVSGHKIGGAIDNAIVIFPDPMGATGSTIVSAMEIYRNRVPGRAKKYIALHLIVTPEYLKCIQSQCPELVVYAVRLDRGLSDSEVLKSIPGTFWDREVGLNTKQYIVPGGGGFGEILNNSYV